MGLTESHLLGSDWPMAIAKCKICGGDITYLQYKDKEQTEKRRPPKYCRGTCDLIHQQQVIHKKAEKAVRKRRNA